MRILSRTMAILLIAAGMAMTGEVRAEPPELISVWQFDEDADEFGTARDAVDNNDGTVNGASSSNFAVFGRALDFDGTDDFVSVPNAQNIDFTAAYTLEGWINSDDTTLSNVYRPIFIRGADDGVTNANDIEVYIQANTKDLIVAHNRGNGGTFDFVGFADPPLGTYFHLAVVFDGTDVQAYYDGVPQAVVQRTTAVVAPQDTDKDWMFGKVNHAAFGTLSTGREQFFDGRMDEVRFWDRALTAGEVAASHGLEAVLDGQGIDTSSTKPGVEEVTTESILVFFTASVYDVTTAASDVPVCISPDATIAEVDIQISDDDAFTERGKLWTPKADGSTWDEDTSDASAFAGGLCATIMDVTFSGKAKTLHLDLNLEDTDADLPLPADLIIDSLGVNVQSNPLGG